MFNNNERDNMNNEKLADAKMSSGYSLQEEMLLQALERQAQTGRLMTNPHVTGFSSFASGDKIRVIGSSDNDGDYQLTNAASGTLTVATGTFTAETAAESITIYQIPKTGATADESAHVNLNRMLCLAVVDFMKAKQLELQGDIQAKEYYIKEFWKKVADDQSNKRNISISTPIPAYSIR